MLRTFMKEYKELLNNLIVIPGKFMHYVYKLPNDQFELSALDHKDFSHMLIGDFNSQSTL